MGWVAAFIPTPVMRGFIEGLACVTIIGQVPHLLGFNGTAGNFFTKLWFVLRHLPDASLAPVLTGLLSFMGMLLLRHLAPRLPAALVIAVVHDEYPDHEPLAVKTAAVARPATVHRKRAGCIKLSFP
jgi:SulP family sulfate permease